MPKQILCYGQRLPSKYRKIRSLIEDTGAVDEDCMFAGIRILNVKVNINDRQMSIYQKFQMDKQAHKE